MILKFPDLETLRLALITGAIPPAVSTTPATAGYDDQDQIWVETSNSITGSARNELKRLGVQIPRRNSASATIEVSCWPELIPLQPDHSAPDRPEQMPVLFRLSSGKQMARLATEILRLGNDRQGYRWLQGPGSKGTEENTEVLLRVVGPPYYSLLRALDNQGQPDAPVAFLERGPRVWVEFGYTHPMAHQIKPADGQMLLLRPPRRWITLPEAPLHDIYEVLEFPLPEKRLNWREGEIKDKLQVVPSLRPGGPSDAGELWVLRNNPVEELNRFVQNVDDQTLHRLAFAVGQKGNKTTIVLRVRQSKAAPPVLVLDADAYQQYLRLPNLFLPVGTRLHPPLRRDEVRKLLASDTSVLTWCEPSENGGFVPQSLPEDAFRPLWDWVDYVLDHERESLEAWVQASQFDFEPFICSEDEQSKPKKPPSEKSRSERSRSGGRQRDDAVTEGASVEFTIPVEADEGEEEAVALEDFGSVTRQEPTELQKQLSALEASFLELDGGLDHPDRQNMWPELASLNGALGNVDDAGVCWMNTLWDKAQAPGNWTWTWFRAEASAVPVRQEPGYPRGRSWVSRATTASTKNREVPDDDLDRLLKLPEPAVSDLKALAAYLVWSARQSPPPQALLDRLNDVQQFLEKYERMLPVRAVWLAWYHLVQLSQGDVLALARARDRLLERLYTNGLRPEQDLPQFLRFAGQPTSQRFRGMRQWMVDLCEQAHQWLKDGANASLHATAQTGSYVDLIFAFGLARLGESDASRELLARAKSVLSEKDDAHQFLFSAYEYRIKQALEGKMHAGPLPAEHLEYLEHMERLQRYVVDRLRKHSHILEPDQRIDPYRHWGAKISDLEKALAELTDLMDKQEVVNRVQKLLREAPKGARGHEQRGRILKTALECAPRVGQEFGAQMLEQAIPTYDAQAQPTELAALMERAGFLEKALFVAAHFDSLEHIHPLVARFQKLLENMAGPQHLQALDTLAAQCFRSLRKLGMRDEIDRLLSLMAQVILEGKDLASFDFKKAAHGSSAIRALLHVAAGWYYFGRDHQAEPVLQKARALLFQSELQPREQTQLACLYAMTVGQAPPEIVQKRLEEIFQQLKGVRDTYTTSSHFSVSQLDVAEHVVRAVVSDDFALGTQARRWLDDDEFLVRRRIHRDVRTMMSRG